MEKLLELLERKAPDLFKQIDPETVSAEELLELLGKALEQYSVASLAEAKQTIKWAECRAVLQEKLAESRLPALAIHRLKKRFVDKIFLSAELNAAISEERLNYFKAKEELERGHKEKPN